MFSHLELFTGTYISPVNVCFLSPGESFSIISKMDSKKKIICQLWKSRK